MQQGAWADKLRNEVINEKRVRPLRGSHLVINHARLSINAALTILHPQRQTSCFYLSMGRRSYNWYNRFRSHRQFRQ